MPVRCTSFAPEQVAFDPGSGACWHAHPLVWLTRNIHITAGVWMNVRLVGGEPDTCGGWGAVGVNDVHAGFADCHGAGLLLCWSQRA